MPIEFGAFVPQGWRQEFRGIEADPFRQYELMTATAQEAEAAGYDSVWVYDHFHTVPTPQLQSVFECWTAMAGLARETRTVRLGQMVTCNGYRSPALLAKMASCVDVMSGGRLILGIGAGWNKHEFQAYGYEFEDTPVRLRRLGDALPLIRAMWTQDRATYEGPYHSVRGAINQPKPVQKPQPPIWIGGSGERVTLKLVARHGDACNVGGPVDLVRHKLEVLKRHCEAVGRDYDSILKTTTFAPTVGTPAESRAVIKDLARRLGRPETDIAQAQPPMTPDQAAAAYRRYAELGVTYFILDALHVITPGTLQHFAQEVIPKVRQ